MSKSYNIDISIDAPFNLKTIELVLQEGINHGFIYYNCIHPATKLVSTEQAALNFYSKAQEKIHGEESYTFIKYQDTFLFLVIYNQAEKISIYMGDATFKWYKQFEN